jgi:hypothetical protein
MSISEPPAEPSSGRVMLDAMNPRVLLSQANGLPVVIKQLVQTCLVLIYPVWALGVLLRAVVHFTVYYSVYYTVRVLLWPVRAWMNRDRRRPVDPS